MTSDKRLKWLYKPLEYLWISFPQPRKDIIAVDKGGMTVDNSGDNLPVQPPFLVFCGKLIHIDGDKYGHLSTVYPPVSTWLPTAFLLWKTYPQVLWITLELELLVATFMKFYS